MSLEQSVLDRALRAAGGNATRAAKKLDLSRGAYLRLGGKSERGRGRPRNTEADAAIARLAREGCSPSETHRILELAGYSVSLGTVRRRMRRR